MTETIRTTADMLTRLGDSAAAHSTNREMIRDIVVSFDVTRRAAFNAEDYGDHTKKSANVVLAMAAAVAAGGGVVQMNPGTWTGTDTLIPAAGVWLLAHGAVYQYSGTGEAVRLTAGHIRGLLVDPGSLSSTIIGYAIGSSGITGHHSSIDECYATNCNEGAVMQLSFYVTIGKVDCYANRTNNVRITNTSISNELNGVSGRGQGITKYGLLIEDATGNCSGIRTWGGTFEGNTVQQIEVRGADDCAIRTPHVECNAAVALTGTVTMTNASTAVTGSGTSFLSQIIQGQYIKLDADVAASWARVASITNDTALVLTRVYNGAGGAGAASVVAGNIRVASGAGAAVRNLIDHPQLGVASGTCPGIDLEAGSNTVVDMGDINLPLMIGASAVLPLIRNSGISGGLMDVCDTTIMLGRPDLSQFYFKIGAVKVIDLVGGGTETKFGRATGDVRFNGAKFGFYGNNPVAKASAIAAPTAPSAGYVQAEAQSMKTAIDAIRVALLNIGITA